MRNITWFDHSSVCPIFVPLRTEVSGNLEYDTKTEKLIEILIGFFVSLKIFPTFASVDIQFRHRRQGCQQLSRFGNATHFDVGVSTRLFRFAVSSDDDTSNV